MAHFSRALSQVLTRSFDGKQLALATSAGMQTSDISRLLKETVPLTAEKLTKILSAIANESDRTQLVHAAVRDFVGENEYEYKARFAGTQEHSDSGLREDLGGPVFKSHFPIDPRAEQVLRYLMNNVQHSADIEDALILLGKFLELPAQLDP